MTSDFSAQAVLSRLSWGKDRAVSIGDLAEVLQWPRRAVEQAVQALRLQGKPVASGPAGIWLTSDWRELDAVYRSLRRRITAQSVTAWAVRSTSRRMRGAGEQIGMFDAA